MAINNKYGLPNIPVKIQKNESIKENNLVVFPYRHVLCNLAFSGGDSI